MSTEQPAAVLEITVRWLENEDQAPEAIRKAIDELVHVLNEHSPDTAEVAASLPKCAINCPTLVFY